MNVFVIPLFKMKGEIYYLSNYKSKFTGEQIDKRLDAIGNIDILAENGFDDVISALISLKEIVDKLTNVSIGEMQDNVITLYDIESGQYTLRYEDDNENILEEFEIFSGKNEDYSLGVN